MPMALAISPDGHPRIYESTDGERSALGDSVAERIANAFHASTAQGMFHLATSELQTTLPAGFAFARSVAKEYLSRICHSPDLMDADPAGLLDSSDEILDRLVASAPMMRGAEYLQAETIRDWWMDLGAFVQEQAAYYPGGLSAFLEDKHSAWRLVGRVTFHLAENKRDPDHPFAFLATYTSRLGAEGRPQHKPLGQALAEYAGQNNKGALVALLTPVQRAAEAIPWVKEFVDSGEIYHPCAWKPAQAFRFLKEIPALEASGLIVRVPDWWGAKRPPRPVVSVKIGDAPSPTLNADALLSFSVSMALDGQELTQDEMQEILQSSENLVWLKGRWVEVDEERLGEALKHWKAVERQVGREGVTFFEGMRLLSGARLDDDMAAAVLGDTEWVGVQPGEALETMLRELRSPQTLDAGSPVGLGTTLRPYQQVGVGWLRFLTGLGLGACLADDMGLGKTIQVIALLLIHKKSPTAEKDANAPSLLVAPASLLANWKSELRRFAPSLSVFLAHPAESSFSAPPREAAGVDPVPQNVDLVITTYAMASRWPWLAQRSWRLVILDEAQAIKNAGTRQTRAVKAIPSSARIALTGTPIENRLSDLWSLFDFLNPGLLGSAKAFSKLVKRLSQNEQDRFGPLRALIRPYILRRLKTDKSVIADLPEKTEVNAFCHLTKKQAVLYKSAVEQLARSLENADGIQRRGIVLASLMRLKQICNHPSQATGDGGFEPNNSGKFERLREICEELAERQQKVLVFTQFREMTRPLVEFLAGVFGRPGLVLDGQTTLPKRRESVEKFQTVDGPPFFVLSLKAGGTGLNLTEASNVVHFDRWWNPAVENQATDRAFRIGQVQNVLVTKFVCQGTIEERIDEMIAAKSQLAGDLLEGGAERLLTEMGDEELLGFVSLDLGKALANDA